MRNAYTDLNGTHSEDSAGNETELGRVEQSLEDERKIVAAILDTVEALIVVLDCTGRIVRFNRAIEQTTGYCFAEVEGKRLWEIAVPDEERARFRKVFEELGPGNEVKRYEGPGLTKEGVRRVISWSMQAISDGDAQIRFIIAAGIDRTESKRLENAILEISAREQRRIGQDLHDGLGQHLTGIAFLSKVQEQRLGEKSLPETADAGKIVNLVNEAIHKARELARGLMPVLSESHGLMSALQQWASEMEDLFQITCRFECEDPVLIADDNAANHLYRIAQEAVHNAIRHGNAKNVRIGLIAGDDEGALTVEDDGCGISKVQPVQTGMGLRIMKYRAGMIGGTLRVERRGTGGTLMTCIFPVEKRH